MFPGLFRFPGHPVLIDKFVENAFEVDVDAISDGKTTTIGGIMEHIEEAGVHSGDSACVIPPYDIKKEMLNNISEATKAMAAELDVIGLMNVQFAFRGDDLYVLEVNPRASRTVPFVSKATGVPLAKLATWVMMGKTLGQLGLETEAVPDHISVKEAVLPFNRFPDVDTLLGPEMRSTGEVMGIDTRFGAAYAKAQMGVGHVLPFSGTVFISVMDSDKPTILPVAKMFLNMGISIMATRGTHRYLSDHGIQCTVVKKVSMGRPHVVDEIKNGNIHLIINTGADDRTMQDGFLIRQAAIRYSIPYATTTAGAMAMCRGIGDIKERKIKVQTIQEYNGHRHGF